MRSWPSSILTTPSSIPSLLIDTSPPATPLCKAYPEPYRNPNEAVAQAIDAYRAALAAAQPSEPVRSKPLGTLAPSQRARPGFAVK